MIGFVLTVATSQLAALDGVLTLQESLDIAQRQAIAMRVARSNLSEAEAAVVLAKARLKPGAQVVAGSTWYNASSSGTVSPSGSQFSSSLQLQVTQLIDISGINRDRIESAKFQAEAQKAAIGVAWNDVRAQVVQKYLAILQALELQQVALASQKSAAERLAKANIRFKEGAISGFDVLRLEAETKRTEQDVIQTEGNVAVAKADLRGLLVLPILEDFDVESGLDAPGSVPGIADLVARALKTRPEMAQAGLAIQALERARKADEKAGRPTLSVTGSFSKNFDPGFGQADQQTVLSANLSIPIVTGGTVKANAKSALERESRARIQFEQIQELIAQGVHAAGTRLATAQRALETARAGARVATEALRLADLRFDEGTGTVLDVVTSQADLTLALANQVNAQYQVLSAFVALQQAVGTTDLAVSEAGKAENPHP